MRPVERYDFDGIELDWMRGPPYFRPGRLPDNLDTLTEFMRQAHAIVRRHSEQKGKAISLLTRVPPCLAEARGIGVDAPAWIREPVADLFVMSSASYCPARIDIAEAIACAEESKVPIYVGFDGGTHLTSPHEGYDRGVPAVLRGVALNGYEQGAAGVYIFNYDYRHHRASPFEEEEYNEDHLNLLTDLADPERLARRDRSYSVSDSALGGVVQHTPGDHYPQVPRALSMPARSTGGPGYEMTSSSKTTLRPASPMAASSAPNCAYTSRITKPAWTAFSAGSMIALFHSLVPPSWKTNSALGSS